jgi:hypothetical protein
MAPLLPPRGVLPINPFAADDMQYTSIFQLEDYMMFTACLPQHSQNPTRTNLIRNSYILNKQMIIDNSCLGLADTQDERFTPFLVIKIKGNDC